MGQEKLTIVFNASAGQNRIMTHTWQQLAYIHGLGAELPSHVFNPDKQVYHSRKRRLFSLFSKKYASARSVFKSFFARPDENAKTIEIR